jgi:hypothetical protein
MIREQQIMQRIVNEIGDEFDLYIITCFNCCDFWKKKEGELIVNKTFKRLINIIADFNLTSADEILDNAYDLIDNPELMIRILGGFTDKYIHTGGNSILNRTMAFCYLLFYISVLEEGVKPTDVLKHIINSDLLYKKETLWTTIKFKLGLSPYPYKIKGKTRAIELITLLRGNPVYETMKDIAEYNELI